MPSLTMWNATDTTHNYFPNPLVSLCFLNGSVFTAATFGAAILPTKIHKVVLSFQSFHLASTIVIYHTSLSTVHLLNSWFTQTWPSIIHFYRTTPLVSVWQTFPFPYFCYTCIRGLENPSLARQGLYSHFMWLLPSQLPGAFLCSRKAPSIRYLESMSIFSKSSHYQ